MRDWKVRGQVYQACSEWKDFTLEEFIELSKIDVPKKLERLWVASAELNSDAKRTSKEKKEAKAEYEDANNSLTERDLVKVFPEFYGKVIELLTNIPREIIDLLHSDVRTEMFDNNLRPFLLSLIYSQPIIMNATNDEVELYEPPTIDKFMLDGEEFHFPKSIKLYDELVPMAQEKMITFSEAADIDLAIRELRSDGVVRFPIFMGIYCRKEDEDYVESVALQRAEKFKKTDMATVWSLFFCIVQLTATSHDYIRKFLRSHIQQTKEQTQKAAV